jgi:hypothetical protein
MKDNLEDFIRAHREDFDTGEPHESGWKKVEAELVFSKQKTIWNSLPLWRAAAIVFMLISTALVVSNKLSQESSRSNISLKEFNEVEAYYTKEIYQKVKLIEEISAGEEVQVSEDFRQLDAMYEVLKEEMKARPSKKVKDALVLNLMVRINLLNEQLRRLESDDDLKEEEGNTI